MSQSRRTQACSWKGLWPWGVYKHPRRPGGQLPGLWEPRWEPAVLPSSAVLCWEPLASTSLSVPCLLGGERAAGSVCVTKGLLCSLFGCTPFPVSLGVSLWERPLHQAPEGSWEPVQGGLHFLELVKKCSLKKITLRKHLVKCSKPDTNRYIVYDYSSVRYPELANSKTES